MADEAGPNGSGTDGVGLEREDLGDHTVLRVTGYLDVSTSPRLREKLLGLAGEMVGVVLLDLGSIEFIDSSALGVILNGWKLLHAQGAVLALVSPQERITKIFEITALTLSVQLFHSLAEARAALDLGDAAAGA